MTTMVNRITAIKAIADSHFDDDDIGQLEIGIVAEDLRQISRICKVLLENLQGEGGTMITEEDVEFLTYILTATYPEYPAYPVAKGIEVAERLKALNGLWNGKGLPVKEIDITWEADQDPSLQHISSFSIGDLQEDYSDWYVKYLHAHMKE